MIYSRSILILGDTDIDYSVTKGIDETGDDYITITSVEGKEIIALSVNDAKDIAKALLELVNGY